MSRCTKGHNITDTAYWGEECPECKIIELNKRIEQLEIELADAEKMGWLDTEKGQRLLPGMH